MVKITEYKNGLKVVSDKHDGVRSVSVGFWFGAGSGFESEENNGISHFTEHVTFKGTEKYSAFEIAKLFEDYGASINAFTSKEATCYYFKCIDENFEKCFALMSHILYESSFRDEELDKERNVIIEEINMVADEPEDICYDRLAEKTYVGTALARTILGPKENVSRFNRNDVLSYTKKMYTPDNTVISVVGNVSEMELNSVVEKYVLPNCSTEKCDKVYAPQVFGNGFIKYEKDFEQVNLAIAFGSLPFEHELSATQSVVSFCLGTGMSSRLFQVLREQKGLVYNVYTSCSSYYNNGIFGIYLNTSGKNLFSAVESVRDEINKVLMNGITAEEIERAKMQIKSNTLFALENTLSTMSSYGKYALYTGKAYDVDKKLAELQGVTTEKALAFCNNYFDCNNLSISYVGKASHIKEMDLVRDFFK
ncbi:MAG: insulinase family protein [Clostridia bacterium]|nr:insulinase family protein [Clostridia bacterium]